MKKCCGGCLIVILIGIILLAGGIFFGLRTVLKNAYMVMDESGSTYMLLLDEDASTFSFSYEKTNEDGKSVSSISDTGTYRGEGDSMFFTSEGSPIANAVGGINENGNMVITGEFNGVVLLNMEMVKMKGIRGFFDYVITVAEATTAEKGQQTV